MEEIKATKKDKKRKHDHIDSGIVKMLKSVDESLDIKEKEMIASTTEVMKESKKKKKKQKKGKDSKDSTLEKAEENRDEKEITDEAPEKKKKRKKRKKSHDNNNPNSESNLDEEDLSQRKKKPKLEDTSTSNDVQDDTERNNYPYEVIPDDHCETPVEAYQDISPLLNLYAQSIQKTSSSVFIYDPFFCEGSMVERMNQLGFTNVYNRKEDFYHMKDTKQTPNYDLLMTNPPYSLDHMDRLLNYCVNEMTKPFCLLLPNYVYMKEYYPKYSKFPFIYITPKNGKRYLYTTPKVIITTSLLVY